MKRQVINLFALYGLYSAVGLSGLYLRAAEPNPPPKPPAPAGPGAAPLPKPADFGKGGGLPRRGAPGQLEMQGRMADLQKQLDLRGKEAVGIEDGPTQVLAGTTPAPAPAAKDEFVNPKVEPGKVKWHADFDTACKVAVTSGKPVLLFQMMGKLDDQFC